MVTERGIPMILMLMTLTILMSTITAETFIRETEATEGTAMNRIENVAERTIIIVTIDVPAEEANIIAGGIHIVSRTIDAERRITDNVHSSSSI